MTPGPNQILRLPTSGKLVKISTIASGNTSGARYWTDGKQEARMLPDNPWLRCHPDGRELFWEDECAMVGEELPWKRKARYAEVPWAVDAQVEDYRRALGTLPALTRHKELYLRLRFWWAANDPVRRGEVPGPVAEGYRENLEKFLALLDVSAPSNCLLVAEMSRNLGDFEKAKSLLQFPFEPNYRPMAEFIGSLACNKDTVVRELIE